MEVRHLTLEKNSFSRRLAISDIHGCSKTFDALIKKINLTTEDQLFILGDFVNRGPKSHKVIDRLIELIKEGYNLVVIRGNHEQYILDAANVGELYLKSRLTMFNSKSLAKKGILKKKYKSFLESSYHFVKTDGFYLVHAGFDFKNNRPFEDVDSMLNIRRFAVSKNDLKDNKIVIGHVPKSISYIENQLDTNKTKIYIDNGCVNKRITGQGNLVCLNLDSLKLTIQQNIE